MAKKRMLVAGDRVPGFRLARMQGGEVKLQDLTASGPVVLAFFKISCPVCQFTFPFLERIHAGGRLAIYGVSQNDADATREFNTRFGITFPTLLDAEEKNFPVSNEFGVTTVPTLFVLERDGTVSRVVEGFSKSALQGIGSPAGINPFHAGENVPEWKAG